MIKYNIKRPNKDFIFIPEINNKGSRTKKTVLDMRTKRKAIFKYQKYNCSEACSEKLSCEIAKVLEYDCAKIELAVDAEGNLGILNYLFVNLNEEEHMDAIAYIKKEKEERKEFYTLKNIKKCLDELDKNLFFQFLKIIIFDALVEEQDRHEENWGIITRNGQYKISPLYDNGCNLLREFYNQEVADKYYSGDRDFEAYIRRSKTAVYKEDGKKYGHFELIKELYKIYPKQIKVEIENIKKLDDDKIDNIINKIPNKIINEKHKEYIKKYLKIRKRILIEIVEEGSE